MYILVECFCVFRFCFCSVCFNVLCVLLLFIYFRSFLNREVNLFRRSLIYKKYDPQFFFNCYLLFERFLNAMLDFQKQNYVCCTLSQNNNMNTYIRSIDGEWIKHFKHLDNWQKIINNVSMNIGQCNQIATYWPSPKQLSIKFLILQ